MNLVEFAQRIKQFRVQRNLTLEEVAQGSGLTRSWLSKVENFRVTPSLPALGRIAQSLGVSIATLVEGLDRKPRFNFPWFFAQRESITSRPLHCWPIRR